MNAYAEVKSEMIEAIIHWSLQTRLSVPPLVRGGG